MEYRGKLPPYRGRLPGSPARASGVAPRPRRAVPALITRLGVDVPTGADDRGGVDRRAASRGQSLVEIALLLPILLLLLAGAGDLARVFGAQVSLSSAARAGALEASLHPTSFVAGQPCDATTNRVTCAVLTEARGSGTAIAASDISLTCAPSPCDETLGTTVTVTITGRLVLITPVMSVFMGTQTLTMTESAVAQLAVRPNVSTATPTPTPPGPTPTPLPTPTPTAAPTPTPTPVPTPTPTPGLTPTPTPTTAPTPTPTPFCALPTSDFSITPTSGKKKKTVFQFNDLSTTTPLCPLTWSWNFGDGAGDSTSTLQNPTHVYQSQGTYSVTLVASNAGGSATRTRTVTVTP